MIDTIRCDCGSDDVDAAVTDVQGRAKTIVFTCRACGRAWRNTEPGPFERIVAAISPVGRTWSS